MNSTFKISLYVAVLIFFFNRTLLPYNLQFSILLGPFLIYYLYKINFLQKLVLPLTILAVFSIVHLTNGVATKDFVISTLAAVSILIFSYSFFFFYKSSTNIELIFKRLTQINFAFTLLALIAMFSGKFITIFWYLIPFTSGYEVIPRLKLFDLEASHYSFALMPLFFYYFWKVLKAYDFNSLLLLLSICLSLLLSFSLGIIAVIGISLVLVFLIYSVKFLKFKPTRIAIGVLSFGFIALLLGLIIFYPENPLFFRMDNLVNGMDTSGRGRTYEALEIGWEVIFQNNPWVGIGLGQFKIIGRETLLQYYQFTSTPDVARLPNCIAESMVAFGLIGLFFKIALQVFLFVKLKTHRNLFQLSLFFALFIYQFTGSYLFNSMEYILWIIAFYPKLSSFNLSNYFVK